MAAHKEVVKVIDTANEFQTALELGQVQRGVVVLDVFNAEWGHCKAISETFRRLFTDAGDEISIRFYAVECNKILHTLRNPDPHQPPRLKPKQIEFHLDTTPACWESILEGRQDHSKPYFVYYKEGKIRGHQEGVDTPKIYNSIHRLCATQAPASKSISDPALLEFWNTHFSAGESVVTSTEFFSALEKTLGMGSPVLLQDVERAKIEELAGDSKGNISAEGLQKWIGGQEFTQALCSFFLNSPFAMQTVKGDVPPESTDYRGASTTTNEEKERGISASQEASSGETPLYKKGKTSEVEEEVEEGRENEEEGGEEKEEEDTTEQKMGGNEEEQETGRTVPESDSSVPVDNTIEKEEEQKMEEEPAETGEEEKMQEDEPEIIHEEEPENENNQDEGNGEVPLEDPSNKTSHEPSMAVVASNTLSNQSVLSAAPFLTPASAMGEESPSRLLSSGEEKVPEGFSNEHSAMGGSTKLSTIPDEEEQGVTEPLTHVSRSGSSEKEEEHSPSGSRDDAAIPEEERPSDASHAEAVEEEEQEGEFRGEEDPPVEEIPEEREDLPESA